MASHPSAATIGPRSEDLALVGDPAAPPREAARPARRWSPQRLSRSCRRWPSPAGRPLAARPGSGRRPAAALSARGLPGGRSRPSMVGTSETCVWRPRPAPRARARRRSGRAERAVDPKSAARIRIARPPTWWSGMQASQRSSGAEAQRFAQRRRAGRVDEPGSARSAGAGGGARGEDDRLRLARSRPGSPASACGVVGHDRPAAPGQRVELDDEIGHRAGGNGAHSAVRPAAASASSWDRSATARRLWAHAIQGAWYARAD